MSRPAGFRPCMPLLLLIIAGTARAVAPNARPWGDALARENEAEWKDLSRQIESQCQPEKVLGELAAEFQQLRERIEKQAARPEALILPSDRDPLDVVLRRTAALLTHHAKLNAPAVSAIKDELTSLQKTSAEVAVSSARERKALYLKVCDLRRRISLANPLLNFDQLVFLTHHRAQFEHMCDQYYGFHARPGGSLYRLSHFRGDSPVVTDLLADAVVSNGRLKGQKLAGGSFISLELSHDARAMYFAWTPGERTVDQWTPQSTYHLFKVDADGKNLVQLTDGPWNDFDPCLLPNGRIVFVSERCGGYLRCGGPRANPTYVLYSMNADGSDIRRISFHETHEWHPSVDNHGMLVYTRWDYVDRDSDVAHHLWTSYPDGRDPRSFHGNYPLVREDRPWMEMSIRAIPGSERYVGVAAPHHGQAYGSLVLIDHKVHDDSAMSQLKRLTPDVAFPESEKKFGRQCYGTPWPLSEDYYLCVFDRGGKDYGIYLVDSFGNRELIWRDAAVPCLDPIPLRPRPIPPLIPDQVSTDPTVSSGTIAIANVYDSDLPWPKGTQIKSLRVVQLFPKETIPADKPFIGVGRQSLARGVLGTAPVESDGSAYFEAPAGVPIYFQALDERGMAVQTMRSDTYLHPGERLSCQGCHESKWQAPQPPAGSPIALRRAPSKLSPAAEGSYPLQYARLVQPVLDQHCVKCHQEKKACDLTGREGKKYGWSRSYEALAPLGWAKHGGNGSIKINGSERSIPGQVGARASRLLKLLDQGHYDVKLATEELRRITLWIDCNTVFYGAYHDMDRQLLGEAVLPRLK